MLCMRGAVRVSAVPKVRRAAPKHIGRSQQAAEASTGAMGDVARRRASCCWRCDGGGAASLLNRVRFRSAPSAVVRWLAMSKTADRLAAWTIGLIFALIIGSVLIVTAWIEEDYQRGRLWRARSLAIIEGVPEGGQ